MGKRCGIAGQVIDRAGIQVDGASGDADAVGIGIVGGNGVAESEGAGVATRLVGGGFGDTANIDGKVGCAGYEDGLAEADGDINVVANLEGVIGTTGRDGDGRNRWSAGV